MDTPKFKVGDKVEKWHITDYANSYRTHDKVELIGGVIDYIPISRKDVVVVVWEKKFNPDQKTHPELTQDLRLRTWDTPEEESEKRHATKTNKVTSIVIYPTIAYPATRITVAICRENLQGKYSRKVYKDIRSVDRLLTVLNSDQYERVISRGLLGSLVINVCKKESPNVSSK